jgi:hypothetical protein
MKATATAAACLAAILGLAACGDSGPTRGTQCRQIMTTFCNRAGGDCQQFPSSQISACIEAGVTTCCAGNCGAHVVSAQAEIDACDSAFQTATCASLDVQNGGSPPAICVGVVRSALTPVETASFGSAEGNDELVGRLLSR